QKDRETLHASASVDGVSDVLGEVDLVVHALLFEIRQQPRAPAPAWAKTRTIYAGSGRSETRRKRPVRAMVVVKRQADLLEVILALSSRGGLANSLNGRYEQAHEDRNDRDHDEQLDQSEAVASCFSHLCRRNDEW